MFGTNLKSGNVSIKVFYSNTHAHVRWMKFVVSKNVSFFGLNMLQYSIVFYVADFHFISAWSYKGRYAYGP